MYALYNYKTRTSFVVLKRARDMKIIKKKYTVLSPFSLSETRFGAQRSVWSVWSEISTGIGSFGADSSGGEEISRPHHWLIPIPSLHFITKLPFYNKITIFPLIVMYFSSRFLSVFGFLIYIIVSCFQTYYINSIFPLNKYQLYSYKFLRASIS